MGPRPPPSRSKTIGPRPSVRELSRKADPNRNPDGDTAGRPRPWDPRDVTVPGVGLDYLLMAKKESARSLLNVTLVMVILIYSVPSLRVRMAWGTMACPTFR